jgi:hypothetical protein
VAVLGLLVSRRFSLVAKRYSMVVVVVDNRMVVVVVVDIRKTFFK